MPKSKSFGQRLRELRKTVAKISQAELARRVGLNQTRVSRYENSVPGWCSPGWDRVMAFAHALGVGIEEFTKTPKNTAEKNLKNNAK